MTTAYIESSALVKLVLEERRSSALRRALGSHDHRVASDLATVEATRAAGRAEGLDGLARARAVLLSIDALSIDRSIIDEAARLQPFSRRSLDAIHVVTAMSIGPGEVVVYSYDQRMVEAAPAAGLATASP